MKPTWVVCTLIAGAVALVITGHPSAAVVCVWGAVAAVLLL